MRRNPLALRTWLATAALFLLAAFAPAAAQDEPSDTPWQEVITGQIQAFRDHDAPAAFSYAGAGLESSKHSFGRYELLGEDQGVIQAVRFIGKDQEYYDAVYQLTEEAEGWRVQGVQLVRREGMAI